MSTATALTQARQRWKPPDQDRKILRKDWGTLTPILRDLCQHGCGATASLHENSREARELVSYVETDRFMPSQLSLRQGATDIYRETRDMNHFHVKKKGEYWVIEMDKFNPHFYPVDHLFSFPFDMLS